MAIIKLHNISVEFPIYNVSARSFKKNFMRLATGGNVSQDTKQHVVIRALNNLSLTLHHGDRIGLIGHNGAGKSTMLKLLAKIYEPTSGHLQIEGHITSILNLTQGIEGECTGYENILIRGVLLGFTRKQIQQHMKEIAELSGLGDYLKMPVRTYSQGMLLRLAFAITTCIHPDILLIDEVFSTGDAAFMEKANKKMTELLNQSSIVVMANHGDDLIKQFCNKALLLESGKIKYFGNVDEALKQYHD